MIQALDALQKLKSNNCPIYVIAIGTMDDRGVKKWKPKALEKGWDFIFLWDKHPFVFETIQKELGNQKLIPQIYIIDKQGNIIFEHQGYNPETFPNEKLIELLCK